MKYGGFEKWNKKQVLEIRENITKLLDMEHSKKIAFFLTEIKQFNHSE
ncbi:hypothetical protein PYL11_06915 [Staphylococcus epidermidis]|nr:hypothetical protein [Staphylococcus epidermidis]